MNNQEKILKSDNLEIKGKIEQIGDKLNPIKPEFITISTKYNELYNKNDSLKKDLVNIESRCSNYKINLNKINNDIDQLKLKINHSSFELSKSILPESPKNLSGLLYYTFFKKLL